MADAEDFTVGYNAWCVMTHPSKSNYAVKSSSTSTSMFTSGWVMPVISGNVTRTLNVPLLNSYFLPDQLSTTYTSDDNETYTAKEVKSQIRSGFGTYTFQGSMDFEMTNSLTGLLDVNESDNGNDDDVPEEDSGNLQDYGVFFKRNSIFHVQFYDGKKNCTVRNCVWSDFSISGSPNSAVRASINFQSNNGYNSDLEINTGNLSTGRTFNSEDFLLPYWRCGGSNIMEFTLSISRPVTPVFLNNSLYVPSYLRVGLMTVSLQMTCLAYQSFSQGGEYSICIGDKKITLNNRVLQSSDYQMTTLSDVGAKSYNWTSISLNDIDPVFKIENSSSSSSG